MSTCSSVRMPCPSKILLQINTTDFKYTHPTNRFETHPAPALSWTLQADNRPVSNRWENVTYPAEF